MSETVVGEQNALRLWLLDQEQIPGAIAEHHWHGRYVFIDGAWRPLYDAVDLTPKPCPYCGHVPER